MTSEEYNKHAIIFFREHSKYYNHNYLIDVQKDTLEYVKSNSEFKFKDDVEASCLKSSLLDLGYIEFIQKVKDIRLYKVTESGLVFIKNQLELELKRR